ncbi:MAG: minichromosome maintenance protein MCM [Candidatus Micrarchaeia archaeon]
MPETDLTPLIESFSEFFSMIYKEKLNELLLYYPDKKSLEVDFEDLEKFDIELSDKLLKEPDNCIAAAKQAVRAMNLATTSGGEFSPYIRFFNFPGSDLLIENISSKSINSIISFKGVITRRADILHKMQVAVFLCDVCDSRFKFLIDKKFSPPKRCPSCKKLSLEASTDDSSFVDVQRAEAQELLEKVRGGTPAAKIELWIEDDLVNTIVPGDNVEVCGVLRLRPPLKQKAKQELLFGRFLDVLHIKSMKKDFEEIEITKEDERRIIELSQRPDIEKILIDSVAPSIYGYAEVKRAIVLQLFGGTRGKFIKNTVPIRDDIHVLLIGDPGIAKTQFLQQSVRLAPKSIYVSGKSVTSAGLTVTAEKDELGDGGWTLKAGALVLASGGNVSIDEFDKISEEDRSSLHEVLESQTVSVAKAGMVTKFRAKTSVLAAANPKYGRFDQNRNIAEQFAIPPTLLSRFDLIFPIFDILDEEKDTKLAEHILNSHLYAGRGEIQEDKTKVVDVELLRKYIAYARRNIRPILSRPAMDKIKDYYISLRRLGKDSGSVAITPRYLEGLVRLSESNAKLRFSPTVDETDSDVAIALMRYVLSQIMTDKETGRIDVDIVATGRSRTQVERLQKTDTIKEIIKELSKTYDSVDIDAVVEGASKYEIDEKTAKRIIDELLRRGDLYEKEHGSVKLVEGR